MAVTPKEDNLDNQNSYQNRSLRGGDGEATIICEDGKVILKV